MNEKSRIKHADDAVWVLFEEFYQTINHIDEDRIVNTMKYLCECGPRLQVIHRKEAMEWQKNKNLSA